MTAAQDTASPAAPEDEVRAIFTTGKADYIAAYAESGLNTVGRGVSVSHLRIS